MNDELRRARARSSQAEYRLAKVDAGLSCLPWVLGVAVFLVLVAVFWLMLS